MDLLDLPSLSDEDELDYEGESTEIVPSGSTGNNAKSAASNVDKVGNAEGAVGARKEAGELSAATKDNENVPISTSSLLEQPSRKRKLQNSGGPSSDEEEAFESFESDNDRRQEVNIEMPGRLAGRVKRIVNKGGDKEHGGSISDDGDDEEEGLEENCAAELFAQILDGKSENHRNLNDDELEELYASLEADPDDQHLRFNTIYVTGALDNMTIYEISRIFAQFNPENVRPMDNNNTAFIVTFANPLIAAEMLLEMSKPLRRIRKPKKPEEGELVESSEEDEGQVKEEDGDDVAIVKDQSPSKKRKGSLLRSDSPVVEVDVESVKIPHGKLRVITQHLPVNKLVFVRFASGFELRRSVYIARDHDREENFTLKNNKIRPGLNVFDEKGKELDWDYEHDTRFFEDLPVENEQLNDEVMDAAASGSAANAATKEPEIGGIKIRSRGRGTKKFLQALKGSDDEE